MLWLFSPREFLTVLACLTGWTALSAFPGPEKKYRCQEMEVLLTRQWRRIRLFGEPDYVYPIEPMFREIGMYGGNSQIDLSKVGSTTGRGKRGTISCPVRRSVPEPIRCHLPCPLLIQPPITRTTTMAAKSAAYSPSSLDASCTARCFS